MLVGCLRNTSAVAEAAIGTSGPVAIVAAGEPWPGGGLRPAIEDLIGAGAIIDAVTARSGWSVSPEAATARAAWAASRDDVIRMLRASVSGPELMQTGYASDVDLAAEYDISHGIPVLCDDTFVRVEPLTWRRAGHYPDVDGDEGTT